MDNVSVIATATGQHETAWGRIAPNRLSNPK